MSSFKRKEEQAEQTIQTITFPYLVPLAARSARLVLQVYLGN